MRACVRVLIGREPGPGLRMFSAKFISLSFPVSLYRGPSRVCNDYSQLGAFCPQGAQKTFSDLKLGIFKYCTLYTVTSEIDIWQKASLDSKEGYRT